MNSLEGKLVYANEYYADKCGWFKVTEHNGGDHLRGKRVMRPDGTIVKNSKLRIKFKVTEVVVVTPDVLEQGRDDAYKVADAQYQYLMVELHK